LLNLFTPFRFRPRNKRQQRKRKWEIGTIKATKNQEGFDLIKPFIDVLEELLKLIIVLLRTTGSIALNKANAWFMEKHQGLFINKSLTSKLLRSRKIQRGLEFLAYSLNRKRPCRYAELNT